MNGCLLVAIPEIKYSVEIGKENNLAEQVMFDSTIWRNERVFYIIVKPLAAHGTVRKASANRKNIWPRRYTKNHAPLR